MKSLYRKIKTFRKEILNFHIHAEVPWRKEQDIKKILVGELLLIRTKYEQAAKVYEEFWATFPSGYVPPKDKEKALKILTGAGLRHRAEGILKALEFLNKRGKDLDLCSFEELKKIPYVSDYVASAVLFLSKKADFLYPDSNIIRIFDRYFGIKGKNKTHPSQKQLKLLKLLIKNIKNTEEKRKFVINLLDFGLFVCKPEPHCTDCPFNGDCCFVLK